MFNKSAEKISTLVLVIGAPTTTLFLTTRIVTDPVNATKLFVAGAFAFSASLVVLFFQFKHLVKNFKMYLVATLLFLVASFSSVYWSSAPFSQTMYGSYGRNTGFVAYLAFSLMSLSMLGTMRRENFKRLVLGLQLAGFLNVLYCLWVITFGDFISWSNPYGNILGTLGNPNFISAFLGIFITTLFAFALESQKSWRYRAGAFLISLIAFLEILDSNAIQGIVVSVGGVGIVGFFYVRARFNSSLILLGYTLLSLILGLVALLGALQKGPFSFIYKNSVSLRGVYWRAGAAMGIENPLTGVGMDSYGDWYRRARSEQAATVMPGPNTITNASHNVVMDFFAYGGWPLLLTYLALILIAGFSAVKVLIRTRTYDSIFVALFASWVCYLTQSIISINQIGLAIWGWLLTGALVSYEYATRVPIVNSEKGPKRKSELADVTAVISPQLVAGLGLLIGSLISIPPLNADMRWRSALDSKDGNKVMAALEPGYLSPSDSQRYSQAVRLFASSNLLTEARTIALRAVQFNPDYFDAWKMLYFLSNSTEKEKAAALDNMKRLDPKNPDLLAQ